MSELIEGGAMATEYEAEASMTEMGLEIGWYYKLFSGLHFSPVVRMGGGKWKWHSATGDELSVRAADIGVGGDLDLVPAWLLGVGVHFGLFYNAFGGLGFRGGFDYTFPYSARTTVGIGLLSDVRSQGYSTDDFKGKSRIDGLVLQANSIW